MNQLKTKNQLGWLLKMAWRDWRSSRKKLYLFIASIVAAFLAALTADGTRAVFALTAGNARVIATLIVAINLIV